MADASVWQSVADVLKQPSVLLQLVLRLSPTLLKYILCVLFLVTYVEAIPMALVWFMRG